MIILFFFLCYWLGLSLSHSWIIFSLLILLTLFFLYRRFGKKVFLCGFSLVFSGVGISYINIDVDREEYIGVVYESHDNYFLFNTGGERLYCYQKEHDYEIGDWLSVHGDKGEITFSSIESSFDFASYLKNKGVKQRLYLEKVEKKFVNPLKLKKYRTWFLSHFNTETQSLVKAVLFSSQDETETLETLQGLHLMRFISASGVYVYAFLSMFVFLLSFRLKKKWSKLCSFFLLLFYLIFTFPRFTIIRILVMSLLRWINEFFGKKKFDNQEILGLGGLAFLLLDKYLAYQDGFILGFGIPIFLSFINLFTNQWKKRYQELLNYAFLALFFLPFELRYYHSLSLLALPLQIVLTPLFILFGLVSLLSFYGLPIYAVGNGLYEVVKFSTRPLNYLRIEIYAGPMNEFLTLFYYVVYFLFIYYLSIGYRPIYRKLALTMVGFLLCYFLPGRNLISAQVSFINVGQGDSCLIRERNKTILIDTGGSIYRDIATECLIPYFAQERIYHLDYVITTHDDYDHCGALDSLMEHFSVGTYLSGPEDFPLKFGEITIQNYNDHIGESTEENYNSLVLGFSLGGKDYLVTGDAPKEIEKMIMTDYSNIPCDILKVGHHGSDTSTSEAFVKYLDPQEAVISVGYNRYGHPKASVLKILTKNNVTIRRTDEEGTIVYFNYIFM